MSELSGFSKESIEHYLRGFCELKDLANGRAEDSLPESKPIMTVAWVLAWLKTQELADIILILQEATAWVAELVRQSKGEDLLRTPMRANDKGTSIIEPTIPNLVSAYILLTYRGTSEKQLRQMASDCEVSIEEIQAVLEGQPVGEDAAGVFAAKLKMTFEEFLMQYPVVRDLPPQGDVGGLSRDVGSGHNLRYKI